MCLRTVPKMDPRLISYRMCRASSCTLIRTIPSIRKRLIPRENQEGNPLPRFDLPKTQVRKYTARRRIALGLPIVGKKILTSFQSNTSEGER